MKLIDDLREQAARCFNSNVADLKTTLTLAADIIESVERVRDQSLGQGRSISVEDLNRALSGRLFPPTVTSMKHVDGYEVEYRRGSGEIHVLGFTDFGQAESIKRSICKSWSVVAAELYILETVTETLYGEQVVCTADGTVRFPAKSTRRTVRRKLQ